jgi:hypothetical protein
VTTERDWRRWAREVEENDSLAALECWKAGRVLAMMAAPTERQELEQMDALRHIARARAHLACNTHPASERGYGRQGRLALGGERQLRLLEA